MSSPSGRLADRAGPAGRLARPETPGPTRPAQLTAALLVALVAAHVLLAPLTLVLAVAAMLTSRLTRWRPSWLAVPAAVAAGWAAAAGIRRALGAYAAGPRQVAAYLAGVPAHPSRLALLPSTLTAAAHGLPRQVPVALAVAAAEAALAAWLAGRRRAAAGAGGYRPGLIWAVRSRLTRSALAAGHVITRDGCALGLDPASGRVAELAWADLAGGLLVASADPRLALRVSFALAAAAAQRRKTLIVVDLTGSSWLREALTAVTQAASAPLATLGAGATDDPLRDQAHRLRTSPASQRLDEPGHPARPVSPGYGGQAGHPARPVRPARPGHAGHAGQAGQAGQPVRLDRAVRERGAVLFSLEPGSQASVMLGRQAIADLTAVLRDLADQGLRGDTLAWVHGVEGGGSIPAPVLAELVALGPGTGTAVVVSASSAQVAAELAGVTRLVVTAGPADQRLAGALAERAPLREMERDDLAGVLRWQDDDEFTIIAGRQVRPGVRWVPAAWEQR